MTQYEVPKAAVGYVAFHHAITHMRANNHNLDTFNAMKLKFGMLFTQTYIFNTVLDLPLGHALG